MKKIVGVLMCLAVVAFAEDPLVGKITASDGGSVCNWSTGYGSAGCPQGEACAQSFPLTSGNKLCSVVCDDNAYVSVSRTGTDAGIGVPLSAKEKFYTDTGKQVVVKLTPDGGTYTGGSICISQAPGATATLTCGVYSRNGLE